jgi:hypothetical protein
MSGGFDAAYIQQREPYADAGGICDLAMWRYRRNLGTWRVSVDVPNIEYGEPFDGAMFGTAVCDDFGVLRVVGGLA